MNIYLIFLLL